MIRDSAGAESAGANVAATNTLIAAVSTATATRNTAPDARPSVDCESGTCATTQGETT